MNRPALIVASGFALVSAFCPTALAEASVGDRATYVGGSVASIPRNTEGFLNLEDTTNLTFSQGKAAFSIAYDRISTMEMEYKPAPRGAYKLLSWPPFTAKDQVLVTVNFEGEKGNREVLVLSLDREATRTTLRVLEARTGKEIASLERETKQPEWWGDRYWKTQRNTANWNNEKAEQKPAPHPGDATLAARD
jgi:hypothetical protein